MNYGGLPFFKFFDETDRVIYPTDGQIKTLWPENCPLSDESRELIKTNFENYIVSFSEPQYWLSRFHNLVKREADKWVKLIASENALTPEHAVYNYDLVETTHFDTSGTSKQTDVRENTSDGMSIGYTSDTPEGQVTDIETYMSAASKQTNSLNDNTEVSSSGEGTSTGDQTLTRKGNIGVMTAAKIIGGYREATTWCAYDEVIFPELEKLFIGVWDGEEEMYGYLYPAL